MNETRNALLSADSSILGITDLLSDVRGGSGDGT